MKTLPKQAQKEKEKFREKRIELMFRKLNIQKEIKQIDEDLELLKEAIKKLDDFQKLFKKDW